VQLLGHRKERNGSASQGFVVSVDLMLSLSIGVEGVVLVVFWVDCSFAKSRIGCWDGRSRNHSRGWDEVIVTE
jgi:hypothetical protein